MCFKKLTILLGVALASLMAHAEAVDVEAAAQAEVAAWSPWRRVFQAGLDFDASATNNVEWAFGADADGDGLLSAEEAELTVGWDCGAWFIREGATGAEIRDVASSSGDAQLRLLARLDARGAIRRASVSSASQELFAEAARPPLFRPTWTHARCVVRNGPAPTFFSVRLLQNGTGLIVR